MPSGAGLLPPTLFESAHKMDASQAAPQTPVAPFSGRNLSPSYAAFGAGRPPTPAPSPVPDSGTQAAAAATVAPGPASAPAPAPAVGAPSGADAVSAFLAAFNPAQMASVAASAAASAATAAVQAASPAAKDKDKDKGKGDEETPVRPWTEGDYPVFDVNGLHPDELRLASLPWKRREELGAAITKARRHSVREGQRHRARQDPDGQQRLRGADCHRLHRRQRRKRRRPRQDPPQIR